MAQSIRPFSPLFSPFLPFKPFSPLFSPFLPLESGIAKHQLRFTEQRSVPYGAVLCTLWSSAPYPYRALLCNI